LEPGPGLFFALPVVRPLREANAVDSTAKAIAVLPKNMFVLTVG